ncbi:hypothetical protein [Heliothis virescens ascovirus 3g]|uniref:Uncharacterized protein n=2 Tax=Ascovirus TaxID=43680 RepID=K4NVI4_9VIRU|nr:hypothetical protein F8204_gp064 [Heliothis virescens ascovirus 3g]AFV50316.1 hypothetical protein [Heliothis virescens ascovirus 3g]AXN77240.1 hypothetical protein HvAV-3i_gp057 [Heliothis virescens ascovirus 3i]
MTRRLTNDEMNRILQIVKAHMFKPKQTLARDINGIAVSVNAKVGETPDLSSFSQEEISKLIEEDGWDVATTQEVYRIISETVKIMNGAGAAGGAVVPKLYPALMSPNTITNVIPDARSGVPSTDRTIIGDMGSLQGPEGGEWLAFFYPAHTVFDKMRMTSVVLNFSSPLTGEYVLQMLNALNPTKSVRDIHKFNGSKSSVMVIGLSEVFMQQTSVTFRLQPAPLDVKGGRPMVRMELHFEFM